MLFLAVGNRFFFTTCMFSTLFTPCLHLITSKLSTSSLLLCAAGQMFESLGISSIIFHSAVLEKSVNCLWLLLFFVIQPLRIFPFALQVLVDTSTASHGLFSLSLNSIATLGFVFVGTHFIAPTFV